MIRIFALTLLTIKSGFSFAQYNLNPGSIIEVNDLGDLIVQTVNQSLQCGTPVSSGIIKSFQCGYGTNISPSGTCVVNSANTPFELDYELENAAECQGELGTIEWQGDHPIGQGTGVFHYGLMNGIDSDTTFKLKCLPQNNRHKFKSIVYSETINLKELIEANRSLISLNKMMVVNYMTGGTEMIPINHQLEAKSFNKVRFMVRQLGQKIYAIPTTGFGDISIKAPEMILKENIATYIKVTGSSSKSPEKMTANKAFGTCDNLSSDNKAAVNIVFDKDEKGCLVDVMNPSFIQLYLLEKHD